MMCSVYFQSGQKDTVATFDLYIRDAPKRKFFVFSGLEHIMDYLLHFQFTNEQISYIQDSFHFPEDVLDYIANLRFTGDLWAMPEGSICFPGEPIIRITAPIIEAQFIEQYLINTVMLQTMLSSKLARVVDAARGKDIAMTFTRSHGVESAVKAVRAGKIVDVKFVGLPLSSMRYGIPMTGGTTFHHFFQSYDTESEAFESYIKHYPGKGWILIDTYDAKKGLQKLIAIAKKYGIKPFQGIFLDSGDLLEISRLTRAMLNDAGMYDVKIMVMSNLDEYAIDALAQQNAPVDWYGVATEVMTCSDHPKLEVVYKLCEVVRNGQHIPKMKLALKKSSLPGVKQVVRKKEGQYYVYDIVCLEQETLDGQPLLKPFIQNGQLIQPLPSLDEISLYYQQEKKHFHPDLFSLASNYQYPIHVSAELSNLAEKTRQDIQKQHQDDVF